MVVNFEEKMDRFKQAYSIYVENSFTKKDDSYISKMLLFKGIELINQGIIEDNKSVFRKNRDLLLVLKDLLSRCHGLTHIQQNLIKETFENLRVYAIVKIQRMWE